MNDLTHERKRTNILDVFDEAKTTEHGFLTVSAPMVRYSKFEFRKLLRQNGVKLCFTPMIIADSFNNSQKARENEFTTCTDDRPLIAQFAACNAEEFSKAAQLIYPYVDGVDLNCGCPQSWAIAKGYGCGLLRNPELISDIIKTVRRRLPNDISVSLKIRLLSGDSSVSSTVELARQMENCGATFLTIHGRTVWQRSSDSLNIPAMADLKQSVRMPVIVNGNVRSWYDACEVYKQTLADGVMAARGLLSNPTLFNLKYKDNENTPLDCVQQWLNIVKRANDNINFQCFHHHLIFMCSSQMKRKLRLQFNSFTRKKEIFDFFEKDFGLSPSKDDLYKYINCTYDSILADINKESSTSEIWNNNSHGKFFQEFKETDENDDIELGESFLWN